MRKEEKCCSAKGEERLSSKYSPVLHHQLPRDCLGFRNQETGRSTTCQSPRLDAGAWAQRRQHQTHWRKEDIVQRARGTVPRTGLMKKTAGPMMKQEQLLWVLSRRWSSEKAKVAMTMDILLSFSSHGCCDSFLD